MNFIVILIDLESKLSKKKKKNLGILKFWCAYPKSLDIIFLIFIRVCCIGYLKMYIIYIYIYIYEQVNELSQASYTMSRLLIDHIFVFMINSFIK
jgi:hypothetical protein